MLLSSKMFFTTSTMRQTRFSGTRDFDWQSHTNPYNTI